MDHVITVRDVLVTIGIGVIITAILGFIVWLLVSMNTDL